MNDKTTKNELYVEVHRHIWNLVNKHKTLDRLNRNFGVEKLLNGSEIHTLTTIGDNNMLTVTQIADLLGVSKAAASQAIGNLQKNGYLKKLKDTENKREVYLSLTEKGKQAYQGHEQVWGSLCLKFLSDLKEEEIENFIKVAEKVEAIVSFEISKYR